AVEVEEDDQHDELELRGAIETLDRVARVFTIAGHGERVSYARPDIAYEKGSQGDLDVGREVRATGLLSADGTMVEATRIRFDD
ncbi:MAG TPA: hypothetical protein VFZ28_03560, partial [Burkholderiaceae bacterium]|nr:hypothetical protein [Burkholderiaceae bacterium]